jgi:hypothetical protein
MNTSSTRMFAWGQRICALLCIPVVGIALTCPPVAAEAASTQDSTVIQVNAQDSSTETTTSPESGAITSSTLESLASQNTQTTYRYAFSENSTVYAFSTNNYVTLDQLISASGLDSAWHEGSSVTITGSDGTTLTQTYEEVTAEQYVYPASTESQISTSSSEKTIPVFALDGSWAQLSGSTSIESALSATDGSLNTSDTASAPHYLYGMSSTDSSYPTSVKNVSSITITYSSLDLEVSEQNAEGTQESSLGDYSATQLTSLAAENTTAQTYLYFVDEKPTVFWTDEYVTVSQLLENCSSWKKGASLKVTSLDGTSVTYTYSELLANTLFYGDYTDSVWSDRDISARVPPVIALAHYQGTISGSLTADNIVSSLAEIAASDDETSNSSGQRLTEQRWLSGCSFGNNPVDISESPAPVVKLTVIDAAEESSSTTTDNTTTQSDSTAKTAKTAFTVNVKTVTAKALKKAAKRFGATVKSATTVTLGKKVKTVKKGALKSFKKVKTVIVKTKKLTKKSVKGSLKGSKVKTIKVKVSGKKRINKRYVKKYKKIFAKKNCGKKTKVK